MKFRSVLMLGTLAGAIALPAFAQDDAAKSDGGEEVIVTATKRARNVQDVPISIEVVGQQKLDQANVSDLLTLASKIPSLTVRTTNAGNQIRMRGVGSVAATNIEQTVAVYKDGIYEGKSRQNQIPFLDIARIEVLRGPQGALIGKNAAAGAVNFVSNNPTNEFQAGLTANYLVDYEGADIFGYVSGPLSDTLQGRVALKYKSSKGPFKNFATGVQEPDAESVQGRITLRYRPSDSFDMVTKFEYADQKSDGHNFFGVPLSVPTFKDAVDLIKAAGGYTSVPLSIRGPGGIAVVLPDGETHTQYDFSNTITVDSGGLTFVAITGWTSYDGSISTAGRHASVLETINTTYLDSFKQASQEFRLQSAVGGTFDWVVGVYGDYSTQSYLNPITSDSRTATGGIVFQGQSHTDQEMETYTYSIFGTGTYHATDALSLVLGARYTGVHKDGTLTNTVDYITAGTPTTTPFILHDSFTDSHFDPSVTIQYQINPDVMIYANYGQGSKVGTLQAARTATAGDFRLKQEVSTSYEVGFKSQFLDNAITLNADAYYMTLENYQVGQYITDSRGLPVLRATNAAKVISRGFELSASADLDQWVTGLSLSFNGAYTDSYYDDYPGATCTTAATAAGCVNGRLPGGVVFNLAGYPIQYVSKWTGTAAFDYTRQISDSLKIQVAGSADMFSSYWFDTSSYNAPTGLQPGDTQYNIRIALADVEDKWSIAFIGENLTDIYRGGQQYNFPGYPGTVRVYGIYGGRNLMVQGTVKF